MPQVPWEAKARFVEKFTGREGEWMLLPEALAAYQEFDDERRAGLAYLECKSFLPLPNGKQRRSIDHSEIDFLIRKYLSD